MITTLDIVDILWQRANGSPLKTSISGGIYKQRRPAGSKKEDIVINCLPVNNLQLQSGIANVNIHVPNLTLAVNGVQDNSQPNHQRLQELAAIAVDVFADQWNDDYTFDVQQQVVFEDEEAGDHYINLRIEFFNINIKN